eukprot:GHVQ01011944.1.p1 GENE.GHVQ01011944.1~~GHVQ01011944.1.p1  ORF type:complete len:304 (+),score=37.94 GHVQ01011944.1:777-1688(+)
MTVTVLSIISMRTIFPRLLYLSIGGFLLLPHLCCNTAPVEETSSWCNPESTDISLYNQCTVFSHHTHTTLPSHKGEEVGSFRGTSPVADTASSILADHSEHISTSSITLADDSTLNPDFMPTLSVPPLLHHKQQQQQLQRRLGWRDPPPNRNLLLPYEIVSTEFITEHYWYYLVQLVGLMFYAKCSIYLESRFVFWWWILNIVAVPTLFSVRRAHRRTSQEEETQLKIENFQRDIKKLNRQIGRLKDELPEALRDNPNPPTTADVMRELALIRDKLEERPEFPTPPSYSSYGHLPPRAPDLKH